MIYLQPHARQIAYSLRKITGFCCTGKYFLFILRTYQARKYSILYTKSEMYFIAEPGGSYIYHNDLKAKTPVVMVYFFLVQELKNCFNHSPYLLQFAFIQRSFLGML
jgi:hypothetical protein